MATQIFTLKDPFRATTEFRFQELESFIHITQEACEEVARQEKGVLEETISGILKENAEVDPAEAAHVSMYPVAEYVHTHHDAIPRYLSFTFVIQVYSLFEELAKDLHVELKRRESIPGPSKLKSHDFLNHFRDFTEKAGIAFDRWSALYDFKDVRNNIVHRNGFLAGDIKEIDLRRIVVSNGSTLSIYKGQIQVAPEYAVENLNLAKSFFSEALRQKKFEDGYWWPTPIRTSFGLSVSGHKATIDIYGTNTNESALPSGGMDMDDFEHDEDDESLGSSTPPSSGPPS
jgi:hypothetical protein